MNVTLCCLVTCFPDTAVLTHERKQNTQVSSVWCRIIILVVIMCMLERVSIIPCQKISISFLKILAAKYDSPAKFFFPLHK